MNIYKDNLTNQTVTVRENKDNKGKPVYLVRYPSNDPNLGSTEIDFKEDKFADRFTKVN